jgi:hypothetical protein
LAFVLEERFINTEGVEASQDARSLRAADLRASLMRAIPGCAGPEPLVRGLLDGGEVFEPSLPFGRPRPMIAQDPLHRLRDGPVTRAAFKLGLDFLIQRLFL